MSYKILYIAEIVSKSGVFAVKKSLEGLKQEYQCDLVIANANSATSGAGLGLQHAFYLHKLGIDIITSGDCIYYKRDLVENLHKLPWIIRPANYPKGNPGRSYISIPTPKGNLVVIQLLGMSGFDKLHLLNPFVYLDKLLESIDPKPWAVFLDFHAATTAEKKSMQYYAANKVSAVIGSHSKTMTADSRIYEGCACITDAGKTGSIQSVAGLDPQAKIKEFILGIPITADSSPYGIELQACFIELDDSGRAITIKTLRMELGDLAQ